MAAPPAPPATLVIFGALGDLTRRLLVPAIVNLARGGLLDPETRIIGVSHHDGDDAMLRGQIDDFLSKEGEPDDPHWAALRDRVSYLKGDFNDPAAFAELATALAGTANAAFYLATAPDFFATIVEGLGDAGLLDEAQGFRRVVIEKPFGTDLASARALNARILARLAERQIYRIDHYLGKETVQNILVTRFANSLLEAVWNSRYIDHVQITAAETVTVGTRGKFYDATGALRDMIPNHLFQLLAMIGMEPPNSFEADAIRTEKAKLVAAIRVPCADDIPACTVRGRYTPGRAGDRDVPDYRAEDAVAPDSRTETFAALKLSIESWRWAGVPFYLRTGKALCRRDTEVVVQFKPVPIALFRDVDASSRPPNRLILQIQPDEGISLGFVAKQPGPVIDTAEVSLDFAYADHFDLGRANGYETLLYDMLTGDQTLFQRADQIEAGWAVVQPVLDAWGQSGDPEPYAAGSDGPAAAHDLLRRDGREWHGLGQDA